MSGIFRDQTYVERCYCEVPAIGPCGSCGRARCAAHLDRGLCNRCTQAVTRELSQRSGSRWWLASASGVGVAVTMLVAHVFTGVILGLPLAVAVHAVTKRVQRRRIIAEAGPALAASKGELEAPSREDSTFPSAPPPNPYTGGGF